RSRRWGRVSGCATPGRSTAPMSTGNGSTPPTSTTATRCRSAATGSASWGMHERAGPERPGVSPGAESMSSEGGQHVSIGDVLQQLRDDFPDVTISKIRFLESQGLLVPERTPSGYRKFYADDVVRLRFILRQQKEHFLPLKVIKERLDEYDRTGTLPPDGPGDHPPALFDPPVSREPERAPEPSPRPKPARLGSGSRAADRTPAADVAPEPEPEPAPEPSPARPSAAVRRAARRVAEEPVAPVAAVADDDDDVVGRDDEPADAFAGGPTGVSMMRAELAHAAALSDDELVQLEEFGLLQPAHRSRDRVLFDDDALEVARIAAAFMRHGVEPRHLRMYRAFVDREVALFEQVLLPFRRRRNPS